LRTRLSAILVAVVLGAFGAITLGMDSAEASYWSKSTSCGTGHTCVSQTTNRFVSSDDLWQARGRSYTAYTYPEFFAWTRGTNIYHIGQIFEEKACQVQNGFSCYTPWLSLCGEGAYPVGCGFYSSTQPFCNNKCYATTWSWFKRNGIEYSLWTAVRSGADSSYRWNTMSCL
jgi:hypothetical protein